MKDRAGKDRYIQGMDLFVEESQANLSTLLSHIDEAVIGTDHQDIIHFINPAAESLTDWKQEEIAGKQFSDIFQLMDEHSGEIINGPVQDFLDKEDQDASNNQFVLKLKKGNLTISLKKASIKGIDGVIGNMILFREIPEQPQDKETFGESEKNYRDLVSRIMETSPAGITVVNRDGHITFANERAEEVLGLKRDHITQRMYNDPKWEITDYYGEPFPEDELPFKKVKQMGEPVYHVRHAIKSSNGNSVLLSINAAPLYNDRGEFDGVVATVEDVTARIERERALYESETRYRSIVQDQTELIVRWLPDGTRTFVNDSYCRYFGRSEEQLIGTNVFSSIVEEDRKLVETNIQKLTPQKPSVLVEHRTILPNQEIRWQQWTDRAIFDKDGKMIELQSVGRDITKRKQAEEKLKESEERFRESEEKYRTIFNNTGTAIILVEEDTTIALANEEFEQITGYSKEDLEGKMSWMDFVAGNHLDKMKEYHYGRRNKNQKKIPRQYEFQFVNRDGEIRDGFLTVSMIPGSSQSVASILDITELRKKDKALSESEEKYRHLIQNSNDAIYVLYNRKFELINEQFKKMFQVTLEDVNQPEFDFMDLVSPKSKPLIEERMRRLNSGEEPEAKYEFTGIAMDGKEIEVEASVSYIKYKDSVATQGILRDITDRKQLEEQLRQSQKMEALGRLAGGVAHDFNNILTAITGYVQLMMMDIDTTNPLYNDLSEVKKASDRASSLTHQLLAFSRKQMMEPKLLNLNEIIKNMDKMLRRLIREDIEFVTILEPNLGLIKADPGQIEQVVVNLAVNGRDAMPTGGKMIIETKNVNFKEAISHKHTTLEPGPYAMLAVSDTGVGMDEETKSHLFEPFFTTKEVGEGTGLGLAMVYGIVRQSGGFIFVYSEPGHGATFKIYFPQKSSEAAAIQDQNISEKSYQGSETILLVEDEDMVRKYIRRILKRYGYTVLEARYGDEALQISQQYEEPINIMVTDMIMPKMSGTELANALQGERPDMKVIFISGYTKGSMIQKEMYDHEISFVQKPFTPNDLIKEIREVLDQ